MFNLTQANRQVATHRARSGQDNNPAGVLAELLDGSGVGFNGPNPWDIQVRDPEVYRRILTQGSLGFGEAYMDGLWEAERLDVMFDRLLRAQIDQKLLSLRNPRLLTSLVASRLVTQLVNRQSRRRAFEVGEEHYDIGNDVFEAMLDPTMSYSCGYWAHAGDLARAQRDKLDMICRKLDLQPGESLLDIGCGWGGLARHAAEQYGVRVTGLTISREQQAYARAWCEGLPVEIRLQDYRELEGRFDKIVSVGMFEHVGPKNYPTFFDAVQRLLAEDGLFLLHTIGHAYTCKGGTDPWLDKYIFPNGKLPVAQQIAGSLEPDLVVRDWHDFGQDYDRTLMAWWDRFEAAWPRLRERYSRRFYRMWRYYLHSCAGVFRSGDAQLWQIVITRRGERGEYRSIRL